MSTHASTGRVLGFDLLRGLCALSVAVYHVFYWQDSYKFYNFSTYGVYIFFILSGASMTIAYTDRLKNGMPMSTFLLLRFFRLAPLYWLIVFIRLGYKFDCTFEQIANVLLNLTFLFGFANPGHTSAVTGGWSIGIEFVFYFMFPTFLAFLSGKYRPYVIVAMLLVLQHIFVLTIAKQTHDIEMNWAYYIQFISFIGYFFSGCLIGHVMLARGENRAPVGGLPSWILFIALLVVMVISTPDSAEQSLTGIHGLVLPLVCVLLVIVAGRLSMPSLLTPVAVFLGSISYSLYLLHSIVFHQMQKFPALTEKGPLLFALMVIGLTATLAATSEHFWEMPIRRWGYRKFASQRPFALPAE